MPHLFAISDIHVRYAENRELLKSLPHHENDWLIVAGDVGETEDHLKFAWETLCQRFAKVLWVPGNHELWSAPSSSHRGVAKYQQMVDVCRTFGVLTPEDPFATITVGSQSFVLAPLFVLYDYSFRPADVPFENALAWALESGILCADEKLLDPSPFPSRQAWCQARLEYSAQRLSAIPKDQRIILINHFPLRYDLVTLPKIPRFSLWCGTQKTENWHLAYNVAAVVTGHLHVPATHFRDGVRFEEVSLGYPAQWAWRLDPSRILRQILPY